MTQQVENNLHLKTFHAYHSNNNNFVLKEKPHYKHTVWGIVAKKLSSALPILRGVGA